MSNSGTDAGNELQAMNDDMVQVPGGWKKYYVYPLTFPAVANGTGQPFNLQIQDDAPFYWQASVFECIDSTTFVDVTPVNVTIQLTDRGSGYPVFESGVPLRT